MSPRMTMNIMNRPMVIRTQPVSRAAPTPAPRRNVLGGIGIIERIRHTPPGCSSCGGR